MINCIINKTKSSTHAIIKHTKETTSLYIQWMAYLKTIAIANKIAAVVASGTVYKSELYLAMYVGAY